jgi:transposase-like protein
MTMVNQRKKYSAEKKVRLLRLHLIEKELVSDICDRHGLNPNVFYRRHKQFLENGPAAFNQAGNGHKDTRTKKLEEKISRLQAKPANKYEVIAVIMASHVQLKKVLARIEGLLG